MTTLTRTSDIARVAVTRHDGGMEFTFASPLWRWEARVEDWYFVTVPAEMGGDIAEIPRMRRGFGAVKVEARIGEIAWRTSIFPQDEIPDVGREYVLPVKRAIREKAQLEPGSECVVTIVVLDS